MGGPFAGMHYLSPLGEDHTTETIGHYEILD